MKKLTEKYKGHTITKIVAWYWTLGQPFKTLTAAKTAIDAAVWNEY